MKLMWRHFSLQAIFPVSFLFSNSVKFPAKRDDILRQYGFFPKLSVQNPSLNSEKGPRRVHLELYLGWVIYVVIYLIRSFINMKKSSWMYFPFSSLEEVWVAVLNITGPLSSWSFADNLLPGMKIVSSTYLVRPKISRWY